MRIALVLLLICSSLTLHAQQQQPVGPTPEERRAIEEAERRREEAERIRIEQQMQRLDDLETRVRLPRSAAEIEAARRKRTNQFKKDLEEFRVISAQIASLTSRSEDGRNIKDVRKRAKSMERCIDGLVEYLMDGEEPPEPAESDFQDKPVQERIALLNSRALPMHQRVKTSYSDPVIDLNLALDLIQDLQNLKLLAHSLRN